MDGYEIEKTVRYFRCGKKMHIPVDWVPTTRQGGTASKGLQSRACGQHICASCTFDFHSGRFQCCSEAGKEGAYVTGYHE